MEFTKKILQQQEEAALLEQKALEEIRKHAAFREQKALEEIRKQAENSEQKALSEIRRQAALREQEAFGESRKKAAEWELPEGVDLTNRKPSIFVENSNLQPIQKHVDPDHYKRHIGNLQWVETEWELAHGDIDKFLFAMLVQMRKYHSRLGKKDVTSQELRKSAFYLMYGILAVERPDKRPDPTHVQNVLKML